ncbi:hypothetical protein ACHAWC_006238, partial [Mediolabrus comicus]
MGNSDTEVEEGGEEYYSSQTVVNLRQLCKERGLKVGGKKQEIIDRLIDYDNEMNNNEEEDNNEAEDTVYAAVSEEDADNNTNVEEEEGDSVDENDSDDVNEEENNNVNDETSPTTNLIQEQEQMDVDCAENNDDIVEQQEPLQQQEQQQEDDEEKYLSAHNINDSNNDKVDEEYNDDDNNNDGFDDDEFDDDAFLPNATTFEDHHDDVEENNEEQQELQSDKVDDDIVVDDHQQQDQHENDEMLLEKTELTIVEPEETNDGSSQHDDDDELPEPPPPTIESNDRTEKEEEEEGWTYEEEAALMAELDSSSRFDDDDEEEEVDNDKADVIDHGYDDGETSTSVDVAHGNEDVTPHGNDDDGGDDTTIQKKEEEVDVVIDQRSPPSIDNHVMGIPSSLPNTFNGKNGGVAEDADLLAELRAISNKSSVDRFDTGVEEENTLTAVQQSANADDNVDTDEVKNVVNVDAPPSSSSPLQVKKDSVATETATRPLPPWKQKGLAAKKKKASATSAFDVDIVVAAAPAPPPVIDPFQNAVIDEQPKIEEAAATVPTLEQQSATTNDTPPSIATTGIKSSLPNTFNGKNGGAAEDADLLAELRAISNKSSVDRFDSGDGDDNGHEQALSTEAKIPANDTSLPPVQKKNESVRSKASGPPKPWQKKRAAASMKESTTAFDVDVVVAAAPVPTVDTIDPTQNVDGTDIGLASIPTPEEQPVANDAPPSIETTGIKSSLPNTFNGKNGGIAEDADLLAELRAISNKTSGNRFDNGGDDGDNAQVSSMEEEGKKPST